MPFVQGSVSWCSPLDQIVWMPPVESEYSSLPLSIGFDMPPAAAVAGRASAAPTNSAASRTRFVRFLDILTRQSARWRSPAVAESEPCQIRFVTRRAFAATHFGVIEGE